MLQNSPLPVRPQNTYEPIYTNMFLPQQASPTFGSVTGGELQAPAPTPAATAATPTPAANAATPTPATSASTASATPAPQTPSLEQQRVQFLNQAMQGFGTNYGNTLINDNLLDSTINSILDEQRGSATQYLDRGRARGIFNDVGYGAGINRINTGAQAASSQLATLGDSVLDRYRGEANNVRDRAYSTISGLLPGQDFSLDPYFAEGNSVRQNAEERAGGDLRSAIGGTNFFDFGNITNTAGQAQGAVNLRDADVATALAERRRRASFGRGLGSQGAF